jgi:hypothetical protein
VSLIEDACRLGVIFFEEELMGEFEGEGDGEGGVVVEGVEGGGEEGEVLLGVEVGV